LKNSLVFSFSLIGQIGFATALPLVMFGLLGRYLDKIYGTAHWFFFAGLLIATIQVFFYLRYIVKKASTRVQYL
jgi:F0F1-type ATP synthase assembly protein I